MEQKWSWADIEMKQEIEDRFDRNLLRVENLVKIYESQSGGRQGRRPVNSADILRAATVLLHASLEDLLRSIEIWKTPLAAEAILNDIPLAGLRAEKFPLGKLAAYRGKTVDEVITQSVSSYLDRESYNNASDLAAFCQRVGIAAAQVQTHFSDVEQLMKRRHNIVHKADREERPGSGYHGAKSISRSAVRGWIETVRNFGTAVLAQL